MRWSTCAWPPGVYFSIRSRFVQVRQVPEMIRLMLKGEKSPSGVSSFQALTMSLAGRVGTGNIAGVATAIAFGGPGALFWMWAVAFLGASTSFVECTLGQIYKTRIHSPVSTAAARPTTSAAPFAHTSGSAALQGLRLHLRRGDGAGLRPAAAQRPVEFDGVGDELGVGRSTSGWIAVGTVIVLAFVIIGGVKRIAAFASIVVPFMAVVYIVLALVIVVDERRPGARGPVA